MSDAATELDAFYAFGRQRIRQGEVASLDELLIDWDSHRGCSEINAAIREGIADVDAGRTQPLHEALKAVRERNGLGHS